MKVLNKKTILTMLFAVIILLALILSAVYLYKNFTNSSQMENNTKTTETNQIWTEINETTWRKDNNLNGETYVFYSDNHGNIKCIHQIEGSGVYVISREFIEIKVISNSEIRIENDVYKLNGNKLISNDKTLNLFAKKPLVYNRMGPIDMEIVKSDEFTVEDIDKKY